MNYVNWSKQVTFQDDSGLRPPDIIVLLYAFDLLLGIAYLLSAEAEHVPWTLTAFLDLDREGNLPTWYSSMQLFVMAAICALVTSREFRHGDNRAWFLAALSCAFLILSVDEVAQVHEWIGKRTDVILREAESVFVLRYTGSWVFILGAPFLLMGSLLLYSLRGYLPTGVLVKLCAGAAVFLGGALGVELISNLVYETPVYKWQVVAEELAEMMGATTMLWASSELLGRFEWNPNR